MLGLGQHLSSLASASPRPFAAAATFCANISHEFLSNKHSEVGENDGADEVEGSPDGSWLGTSDNVGCVLGTPDGVSEGTPDGFTEIEGSPDGSWLGTSDVEASTKVEMNFLSL